MTTKEQFTKDVTDHVLEIIRDDGVNRHIRVQEPGTMCMHIDLITWPGYLCYTGDMGTYVFSRITDMFEFFRKGKSYHEKDSVLDHIDRRYWAEKLQAVDRSDGVLKFDVEMFKREITNQRRKLLVKHGRGMSKDMREDLWESLQEVMDAADEGEHSAITEVRDWYYAVQPRNTSGCADRFHIRLDTDEFPSCKTYTHRFLWCCYALRWATDLYDKAKNDTTNSNDSYAGDTSSATMTDPGASPCNHFASSNALPEASGSTTTVNPSSS